ncbi:MAG: hypothetical protein HYY93_04610 [Planctomycetes bacterium]|nr:hypothetical protein [Planctomycetota bacterium]
MLVHWFSAFALLFSVGCLGFCLQWPVAEVGRGLHKTIVILALALAAVAIATRSFDAAALPTQVLLAYLALLVIANGLLWIEADRFAVPACALSTLAGLGAVATGLAPGRLGAYAPPWVIGAGLVSSAALIGATFDAMILGHWYLVKKGLSFDHLSRITRICAATVILRAAAFAVETGVVHGSFVLQAPMRQQLLLLLRLTVGIVLPAVLFWMTWRCVRLKSNQSATGILYVACVIVLMGEMVSTWALGEP